jgi:hypothetical protein
MIPADSLPLEQLIGRRVVFRCDEEHAECWHCQVGLVGGVVRKPVQSLAQKAEMMAGDPEFDPEVLAEFEDVPKVWVKADPCPRFPGGCEAAVEPACLLVLEPGEAG